MPLLRSLRFFTVLLVLLPASGCDPSEATAICSPAASCPSCDVERCTDIFGFEWFSTSDGYDFDCDYYEEDCAVAAALAVSHCGC
ncbi:MAG: hypothetical protein AB1405_15730 [Bdellovibrionota bacterium]